MLEKDLQVTSAVQTLLLPRTTTLTTAEYELVGFSRAAQQSGGDWWWCDAPNEDDLLVIVGDVSGHGTASAMVSASLAGIFHALRGDRTLSEHDLATRMSDIIARMCSGQYFVSFALLRYAPKTGELSVVGGALPPVMIYRAAKRSVEVINVQGKPLGAVPFGAGSVATTLLPGDRLMVMTDGLPEAESPAGKQLRMKGASRLLTQSMHMKIADASREIVRALEEYLGSASDQEDDVTFVLVDRKR